MRAPQDTTVLVVDDEPILRDLMAKEFQLQGFQVKSAGSGSEAYEIVKQGAVDVVVSDIRMADGSGIELLQWTKASHPHVPVILMTGYSGVTVEETLDMGGAGVFVKPFDRKALIECILGASAPIEDLWAVEPQATRPTEVQRQFKSREEVQKGRQLAFGTRGFYLEWPEGPLPRVGELLRFDLAFDGKESNHLNGCGHIRWSRSKSDNHDRAVGVEIRWLSPECRPSWTAFFKALDTRKFIPHL